MASLSRATNVATVDFVKESAMVATGYSLMRVLSEIMRSEVVNLQFPGAHAVYSFAGAGAIKMFTSDSRAGLIALGMVANGVSQTWSDLTR